MFTFGTNSTNIFHLITFNGSSLYALSFLFFLYIFNICFLGPFVDLTFFTIGIVRCAIRKTDAPLIVIHILRMYVSRKMGYKKNKK